MLHVWPAPLDPRLGGQPLAGQSYQTLLKRHMISRRTGSRRRRQCGARLKKNGVRSGVGRHAMAYENHWLPGFNFNVEEWDAAGQNYETLAICRSLALARRVRSYGRGEPRRPLHDPQQDARGEAAPGGRLVSLRPPLTNLRALCAFYASRADRAPRVRSRRVAERREVEWRDRWRQRVRRPPY